MNKKFDIEEVNKVIHKEFSRLRDMPPLNIKQLEEAKKKIIKKIYSKKNTIIIGKEEKKKFLLLMAGCVVSNDHKKDWYLYRAIRVVLKISDVKKLFMNKYGKDYREFIHNLNTIGVDLEYLADCIDYNRDNPKLPNGVSLAIRNFMFEVGSRIEEIHYQLNQILILITLYTSLGNEVIPKKMMFKMSKTEGYYSINFGG